MIHIFCILLNNSTVIGFCHINNLSNLLLTKDLAKICKLIFEIWLPDKSKILILVNGSILNKISTLLILLNDNDKCIIFDLYRFLQKKSISKILFPDKYAYLKHL